MARVETMLLRHCLQCLAYLLLHLSKVSKATESLDTMNEVNHPCRRLMDKKILVYVQSIDVKVLDGGSLILYYHLLSATHRI